MRRQEAAEWRESGPEIKFRMRWIFSLSFFFFFFVAARHGDIQDFLQSPSVVLSNIRAGRRGGGGRKNLASAAPLSFFFFSFCAR